MFIPLLIPLISFLNGIVHGGYFSLFKTSGFWLHKQIHHASTFKSYVTVTVSSLQQHRQRGSQWMTVSPPVFFYSFSFYYYLIYFSYDNRLTTSTTTTASLQLHLLQPFLAHTSCPMSLSMQSNPRTLWYLWSCHLSRTQQGGFSWCFNYVEHVFHPQIWQE